jgi:hypothetical protein
MCNVNVNSDRRLETAAEHLWAAQALQTNCHREPKLQSRGTKVSAWPASDVKINTPNGTILSMFVTPLERSKRTRRKSSHSFKVASTRDARHVEASQDVAKNTHVLTRILSQKLQASGIRILSELAMVEFATDLSSGAHDTVKEANHIDYTLSCLSLAPCLGELGDEP